MSDFDNTNSGALFKNDKKSDKQPDYRGPLNVDGKDFEVAAWLKTAIAGASFMSLSILEKASWKKHAPKQAVVDEDFDDDVPF